MINYKIEKSKYSSSWILWEEIIDKRGLGCHPIYRGRTRKECKEILRNIKLKRHKRNIRKDVINKEIMFYEK